MSLFSIVGSNVRKREEIGGRKPAQVSHETENFHPTLFQRFVRAYIWEREENH
jgi:hypothetical protein